MPLADAPSHPAIPAERVCHVLSLSDVKRLTGAPVIRVVAAVKHDCTWVVGHDGKLSGSLEIGLSKPTGRAHCFGASTTVNLSGWKGCLATGAGTCDLRRGKRRLAVLLRLGDEAQTRSRYLRAVKLVIAKLKD